MRGAPASPLLPDKARLAWTASCSAIAKVFDLRVPMTAIPWLLSFEPSLCKPCFKPVNLKKVNPLSQRPLGEIRGQFQFQKTDWCLCFIEAAEGMSLSEDKVIAQQK